MYGIEPILTLLYVPKNNLSSKWSIGVNWTFRACGTVGVMKLVEKGVVSSNWVVGALVGWSGIVGVLGLVGRVTLEERGVYCRGGLNR